MHDPYYLIAREFIVQWYRQDVWPYENLSLLHGQDRDSQPLHQHMSHSLNSY